MIKEGHQTTKHERYPSFHHQWEHLIEAIRRLKEKGRDVPIYSGSIFDTWELVAAAIYTVKLVCDHPKDQLEDNHDSTIYCHKCNRIIEYPHK